MHPNLAFRQVTQENNIDFARERSFGILAVNAPNGPLISHIPFQLSIDGNYLEAHLVRSNPIVQLLGKPVEAVLAVSGGDAYISPDWYGVDNQVPTWSYIAVHIRGTLRQLENQELRGILDRISANMEERLLPKKPWTIDKMDDEVFLKMSRQIVPIGMKVEQIEGTWKLSQNKAPDVIKAAAQGLENGQTGSQVDEIAKLMSAIKVD